MRLRLPESLEQRGPFMVGGDEAVSKVGHFGSEAISVSLARVLNCPILDQKASSPGPSASTPTFGKCFLVPRYNEAMRAVLLQKTATSADLIGFVLARHREARNLTVEAQAALLGIDGDALVRLSLCKAPRPRQFRKDVEAVCRPVGAAVEVLADILKS
jgi:hypothetical protein